MLKIQLPGRGDQGSTRVNDILHQFPFSLPYSGAVDHTYGDTRHQGTTNFSWLANQDSDINVGYIQFRTSIVNPALIGLKTSGLTVRCDQGSTRVNDILHQFPFSLPYSGDVLRDSGATVNQGTAGVWWSQGANSTTNARYLDLYGNYTAPEDNSYKTYGLSVRCVAQ